MSFLYPMILWGLAALAIPLIIHLFNFRRTKKVFFTNLAFLKKVETQTSSFRKLKQWLVMLARMLAIACMVVAFAQPFIPAAKADGMGDRSIKSIYLDNSQSMQNTAANKRFIDLAIIKLESLLDQLGSAANLQFLSNDFDATGSQLKTPQQLKEDLTSLDLSVKSRRLDLMYRKQRSNLRKQNSNEGAQLFWISDFQKSTTGNLSQLEIDSSHTLYVIPVKGEQVANVYVDSVWCNSPFIREMQNNTLKVRLKNSGTEDVVDLPIKLKIGENQASGTSASIPANGAVTVDINFALKSKGDHTGEISFQDQPITFDNNYFFTLTAAPTIKILHLYEQIEGQNYISKLYQNDSLFDFKSLNIRTVDFSGIEGNDCVILENTTSVTASNRSLLEKFVADGGSLVFIPSTQVDSLFLTSTLSGFGFKSFSVNGQAKSQKIEEPNTTEGFYSDVFDRKVSQLIVDLPTANTLVNWEGLGERILSFESGKRFLTRTNYGKGKVYMMAAPLNSSKSTFAEHAFFVPTFLKIAAQSVQAQALSFSFDDPQIEVDLPSLTQTETAFKLRHEKGEIIPVQRFSKGKLVFTMPSAADLGVGETLDPGFYTLSQGEQDLKVLAFNNQNLESSMDFYTSEELKEVFANQPWVRVFDGLLEEDFVGTFAAEQQGTPLWMYFVYAALFFLLIEILLIRFMKG